MHTYTTGRTTQQRYDELHRTEAYTVSYRVPLGHGSGTQRFYRNCDSLLDVGCGRCPFAAKVGELYGIPVAVCDISPVAIAVQLEHGVNAQVADLGVGLPYPDQSFDAVTCFDVLEHLPEYEIATALKELARVARKKIVCTISFIPASRDVREYTEQLHLTVHPEEWWMEQIERHTGHRASPRVVAKYIDAECLPRYGPVYIIEVGDG